MAEGNKLHIVMLPWLAFGHIIPYLELSKLLAKRGHRISFISTPRNIDRLPKFPSDSELSRFIDFVKIPLPKVHNLPENAEATIEVPFHKVKYLKLAYDGLQLPLSLFLEKSKPDWIFHDFASYWLPPIAAKLKISSSFFSIYPASLAAVVGPIGVLKGTDETITKPEDFVGKPKWLPFETTIGFKHFEVKRMIENFIGDDDGNVSDLFRYGSSVEGCDFVTFRSSYELEPEWLSILNNELYKKPVIPVGMLLPTNDDTGEGRSDEGTGKWEEIKLWLDNQPMNSVVYIAFGSEMKPEQSELDKIALGLEESGLPFFWVLRTKRGESDTEILRLPEGFEERTKGRGFIFTSWAPQLKILSHRSVGGLLIHSGWSSVMEAIKFEKVIVMLTFLPDQGVIGRFLNEKKIAHLIPRDSHDGSFTSKSVADALRLVMVEEEGQFYLEKIKKMKELLCDLTLQDNYIDKLLYFLQNNKK